MDSSKILKKVYARVGLMGNPSDGFYGKTISLSIKNFWADVTIQESPTLRLLPHPRNDPIEFICLKDLYSRSTKDGYKGELLQATCKKFYQYCNEKRIVLEQRNFTLSYDTNIPRQVGLAGSSAIITGVFKCLMTFYNLDDSHIPKHLQPSFTLSVEQDELNIKAGLQDRVVQIYEGLLYMDFNKRNMDKLGYGVYTYIKEATLPKMFLVYENSPSDSGKIHSDIALQFSRGNQDVKDGMTQLAHLADKAYDAIVNKDWTTFRKLADGNFALRRQMYGDEVLGKNNLQMIEIGKQFDAAVKFPGSGGAILGIPGPSTDINAMAELYKNEGFIFTEIIPIGVDTSKAS